MLRACGRQELACVTMLWWRVEGPGQETQQGSDHPVGGIHRTLSKEEPLELLGRTISQIQQGKERRLVKGECAEPWRPGKRDSGTGGEGTHGVKGRMRGGVVGTHAKG